MLRVVDVMEHECWTLCVNVHSYFGEQFCQMYYRNCFPSTGPTM